MARSTEQGSGGLSPPRQLQIEQMGADSTTACTSPRTRWRSLRVCLRVFALRVRVSVCERGFACACVCVSVLAGFVACPASVLRTPGRPRAPAAARTAAAVRSPKILLLRVFDNNECTDRYCAGIRDAVLRWSGWLLCASWCRACSCLCLLYVSKAEGENAHAIRTDPH